MNFSRFNKPQYRNALGILVAIVAFLLAYREGMSEDQQGDFFIFWQAGRNFIDGKALYQSIGGAEEFLYPPIAPMVFQLLALLPFHASAVAFSFLNLGLWVGVFWVVVGILRFYYPNGSFLIPICFGVLASARYFWHTFIWVNINIFILSLCLLGIYWYLSKKENKAILCFVLATGMKVMPGIFLILLAIKSNWITRFKLLAIGLGIVFSPLIFRGIHQGTQDWQDYLNTALIPFLNGKVYTDWISFSVSSMVFKLLTAHPPIDGLSYNLASWPPERAKILSKCLQLLILGSVLWIFIRNRFVKHKPQILDLEWVLAFLTMVLVAGVSWEGHHVSMALCYPLVYLNLSQNQQIGLRKTFVVVCGILGILVLDLLGTSLYNYAQGFSLITFVMLFLLSICLKNLFTDKTIP